MALKRGEAWDRKKDVSFRCLHKEMDNEKLFFERSLSKHKKEHVGGMKVGRDVMGVEKNLNNL